MFRFLFQNKKDLLELYNAVNGSDYTDPEALEIITLEDVLFMKMKNDLSFMISDQLNLYEHQSTYSPNLPLLFNINRGHNRELMGKCRRLWEYSEFIAEVNDNLGKDMSLDSAITTAIDNCIRRGILEDILLKNRAEVLNMLLTEYDEKSHMRATYKEGYEEGEQAGYSKGEQALLRKQVQKKLQRGANAETIAEELETELEAVKKIIDELRVS